MCERLARSVEDKNLAFCEVTLRKEGESGIAVKERFVYDAQNRLLQHFHQVDNNTEELLAENNYNQLSQLANKKVGNNLQSIDYTYNIRGWMTHINKDQMTLSNLDGKLFSYKIKYNQKEGIENPDQVQFSGKNVKVKYNGNIAEVDWRAVEVIGQNPSTTPERYGYAYDRFNRLLAGYYQNPNNPNSKENTESLDYDLNGNITNLYRTSVISYGTNTATVIDDLTYTYAEGGNKLTGITDSSQNQTGYENYPPTYPINYDLNGNMLSMYGKGISSIHYNFLNLPNEIYMGFYSPFYVSHMYRADGSKLRKNTESTVSGYHNAIVTTEVTDYLDGFQYKNTKVETLGSGGGPGDVELLLAAPVETRRAMEVEAFSLDDFIEPADPEIINPIGGIAAILKTQDLQFFPTAEGFYDYQKDQYIYQYKDHLGNARMSFGKNSEGVLEITDANDYYPFGMNHLKTGNAFFGSGLYTAYKYNGKELQESGMYDYGARFYMPDIGRWGVVDPLAEVTPSFSPYAYALNNPIRYVDPTGMIAEDCPKCPNPSYEGQTMTGADGKDYGAARQQGDTAWDVPTKPLEWLGQTDIEGVTVTRQAKSNESVQIQSTSSDSYYGNMEPEPGGGSLSYDIPIFAVPYMLLEAVATDGLIKGGMDSDNAQTTAAVGTFLMTLKPSSGGGGFNPVNGFKNAISPLKGGSLTNAGRAVTKHPQYFGFESTEALMGVYRSPSSLNKLGSTTLKNILRNGTAKTGAGGRYPNGWTTYTLQMAMQPVGD